MPQTHFPRKSFNFVETKKRMLVAERHFSVTRRRLREEFGPGVPIPCGVTAEAVEAQFVFNTLPSLLDVKECPATVYRFHFEIDADNVSDDHVVFAVCNTKCLLLFHSYANQHPVRVERVKRRAWLKCIAAMCEENSANAWLRVFNLQERSILFVEPVSISCHCSFSNLA